MYYFRYDFWPIVRVVLVQHSGLTMGVRVRMRVRMEDELGLRVRGESDEGE